MEGYEHILCVNSGEAALVEENIARGRCYSYYTAALIESDEREYILEVEVTGKDGLHKPAIKFTLSDENGVPQAYKSIDSYEDYKFFSRNGKYTINMDNRDINFSVQIMSLDDIVSKLPVMIKKTENGQQVELLFNNIKDFQQLATDVLKPEELMQRSDFTIGGKLYNDINFIEFYADVKQEIARYKKIESLIAKRNHTKKYANAKRTAIKKNKKSSINKGR